VEVIGNHDLAKYTSETPMKSDRNIDIYQFMDLLHYAIKVVRPGVILRPAFPDEVLDSEHRLVGLPDDYADKWDGLICYRMLRREPATLTGEMFAGRRNRTREVKPRIREVRPTHDVDWYKVPPGVQEGVYPSGWFDVMDDVMRSDAVEIYGQWFDNEIQFDCFATTVYDVERLTEWFEIFMETYTGVFIQSGIQKMVYLGRVTDSELTRYRSDIRVRSVRWGIRTERIFYKDIPKIRKIGITLKSMMSQFIPDVWEVEDREAAEAVRDRILSMMLGETLTAEEAQASGLAYEKTVSI